MPWRGTVCLMTYVHIVTCLTENSTISLGYSCINKSKYSVDNDAMLVWPLSNSDHRCIIQKKIGQCLDNWFKFAL
jgi:hypothetical protein